MRTLIEFKRENLIECDTNGCGFVVKNESGNAFEECKQWIGISCPYCKANLLTKEDYYNDKKIEKVILFLNKWFSWITIFYKKDSNIEATAKAHRGIKITKK
jgi:hypothetical protein